MDNRTNGIVNCNWFDERLGCKRKLCIIAAAFLTDATFCDYIINNKDIYIAPLFEISDLLHIYIYVGPSFYL